MRFHSRLMAEIAGSLPTVYSKDNWASKRFGPIPVERRIANLAVAAAAKLGFSRVPPKLPEFLETLDPFVEGLNALHDRFADAASRDLLVQLFAFRALGYRHIRLPLSTPDYERRVEEVEALFDANDTLHCRDHDIRKGTLDALGVPIRLFAYPLGAFDLFVIRQYEHRSDGVEIAVGPGEVVIDAGGFVGDSALYFAHRVGAEGRVFSFEFIPTNLDVFRHNMELNPELAPQIETIENAVWSDSGRELFFEDQGAASRVSFEAQGSDDGKVSTMSIDDLVESKGLERLDFIKMDIEGAETHALRGAEHAIRRFRPTLGISLYHRLEDFVEVPEIIDSFGCPYDFYLGHASTHNEETVLFARPR